MKNIKVIQVASAQGCLERNLGTEKFPKEFTHNLGQVFANTHIAIREIPIKENDFEETCEAIREGALQEFNSEKIPFYVGGDHSITYPIMQAFSEKFGNKKTGLIVFDAHVDCAVDFLPASHEDIIRGIVKKRFVKPENVLILGVRKIYDVEKEFLEKNLLGKRIRIIKAKEIKKKFGKVQKSIQEFVQNKSAIYLSIDIDVFDPSIAPGTGYLEKNGLLEKEFFELFEDILNNGKDKIKGIDLVEVNPEKDKAEKTQKLALKILEKIIT